MKNLLGGLAAIALATCVADAAGGGLPNNFPLPNDAGFAATYSTRGFVDFTTPFHQPLGTNGRSCGTCHLPTSGWSITPRDVKVLFTLTGGTHPLFRTLDANNPAAPVGTVRERKAAYSLLLDKGLFRRTTGLPAGAQFEIVAIDDPYGTATMTQLTTYRRPLSTTTLDLISGVQWDLRSGPIDDTHAALLTQVRGNITGAQQCTPALQCVLPDAAVMEEIVSWEASLTTAQVWLHDVGSLDKCGARGGAENLAQQPKVEGRFDLFDNWIGLAPGSCTGKKADARRAQIARGQELFNTALNANGRTCGGCHNVANNGTHMSGAVFNIGVSAASRRTPDLPLYTLRNLETNETVQTTDPGRAMVTGRWSDISRFKVPSLRGLSTRAPYFHNGSAATLPDVVRFYEQSLGFDLSDQEETDLVAFMRAL